MVRPQKVLSLSGDPITTNTHVMKLVSADAEQASLADGGTASSTDLTPPLTISFYLRPDAFPGTPYTNFALITKSNSAGNQRQYSLHYNDNGSGTDGFEWFTNDAGSNGGNNANAFWDFTLSGSDTTWYHIVLVHGGDSDADAELYVDGTAQFIDTGNVRTSIFDGNAAFIIGDGAGQANFDGMIDDVRIWKRVLSTSSVSSLNSDPCNFDNGANMEGWWRLDNDLTDFSDNGNTLTDNNTVGFVSTTTAYSSTCAFGVDPAPVSAPIPGMFIFQ